VTYLDESMRRVKYPFTHVVKPLAQEEPKYMTVSGWLSFHVLHDGRITAALQMFEQPLAARM